MKLSRNIDLGKSLRQVFGDDPRTYSISSTEFVGDDAGNLKAVRTVDIVVRKNVKNAHADSLIQKIAGVAK